MNGSSSKLKVIKAANLKSNQIDKAIQNVAAACNGLAGEANLESKLNVRI